MSPEWTEQFSTGWPQVSLWRRGSLRPVVSVGFSVWVLVVVGSPLPLPLPFLFSLGVGCNPYTYRIKKASQGWTLTSKSLLVFPSSCLSKPGTGRGVWGPFPDLIVVFSREEKEEMSMTSCENQKWGTTFEIKCNIALFLKNRFVAQILKVLSKNSWESLRCFQEVWQGVFSPTTCIYEAKFSSHSSIKTTWHNRLNAETDKRIQLSSIKPVSKGVVNRKNCHSSH